VEAQKLWVMGEGKLHLGKRYRRKKDRLYCPKLRSHWVARLTTCRLQTQLLCIGPGYHWTILNSPRC